MAPETETKTPSQTCKLKAEQERIMEPQEIPKVMDASFADFVKMYLPLYSGPQVKVQIGSHGHEYILSKAVLSRHSVTSRAIEWASFLPKGHAVRKMLAMAVVEGYLRSSRHKFFEETQEIPSFGMDVLNAVKSALNTLRGKDGTIEFTDPISGLALRTGC